MTDPSFIGLCFLIGTCTALMVTDVKNYQLPDWLTLPMIPTGLVMTWWIDPNRVPEHIMATIAAFSFLMLIRITYKKLRSQHGLGMGDAKLLAAAGAWLGVNGMLSVLLLAPVLALLFVGGKIIFDPPVTYADKVPFGAFMAVAILFTWTKGPILFS